MNKKDLKNEMIVETRHGTRYLYYEGVMRSLESWNVLANYTDNLNNIDFRNLDIVKVYKSTGKCSLNIIFNSKYLELVWQRPEIPELSEREIEVLKALDVLGFKYIARDGNSNIYAYYFEPKKFQAFTSWFSEGLFLPIKTALFTFITLKEPTSIEKLLDLVKE